MNNYSKWNKKKVIVLLEPSKIAWISTQSVCLLPVAKYSALKIYIPLLYFLKIFHFFMDHHLFLRDNIFKALLSRRDCLLCGRQQLCQNTWIPERNVFSPDLLRIFIFWKVAWQTKQNTTTTISELYRSFCYFSFCVKLTKWAGK